MSLFSAKNHPLPHRIPNFAFELDMLVTARAMHAHIVEQIGRAQKARWLEGRSTKCTLVKIQPERTSLVDQLPYCGCDPHQTQKGVLNRKITPELENTLAGFGCAKKKNVTKHDQCLIVC